MPRHMSNFNKPDALVLFTDRIAEQEVIRNVLSPRVSDESDTQLLLTTFYGVGGTGKSTLCRRSLEIAGERSDSLVCAHTSLDDQRWVPGIGFAPLAIELCRVFQKRSVDTPLTLGLLAVWAQSESSSFKTIDDKWQMVLDAIDKGVELAGVPGLSLLIRVGLKWRDRAQRQSIRRRLVEGNLWPAGVNNDTSPFEIEKMLPRALFLDIRDWLVANARCELRLLIDGFERIQSIEDRWDAQRGIEELCGHFARQDDLGIRLGFRTILFGREIVRWDDIYADPDWKSHWNQHLLGGLAETDAREFLHKAAIWRRNNGHDLEADTIEKMQDEILDAADECNGASRVFYPYYLDLAVDLVDRADHRHLDFGRAPRELQERFFRYLDPREKRALMILALAETFDDRLFDWLAESRLVEYPVNSFHSMVLAGRSYINKLPGDVDEWRLHRQMESALHGSWLADQAIRGEGRMVCRKVLEHFREIIGNRTRGQWGQSSLHAWARGMELLVTQGPELGLLDTEEWVAILNDMPWSSRDYALLPHRRLFAKRIHEACERRMGADCPHTAFAIYEYASVLHDSAEFRHSVELHERAYRMRAKLLGDAHRHTLESLCAQARGLVSLRDYAEAEHLCRRAVNECQIHLGAGDQLTLAAYHNLGLLMDETGQMSEAERAYEVALTGRECALGVDDPDTLKTMNNLANLKSGLSQYREARELYERVLSAKIKKLGENHPSTLNTAYNMAIFMDDIAEYDAAEHLYRTVVYGRVKLLGLGHPDTNQATSALVQFILHARGDWRTAAQLCRADIDALVGTMGPDHLAALRLRQSYAEICFQGEQYREGLDTCRSVLEQRAQICGGRDIGSLDALLMYAKALAEQGMFADAEQKYLEAIDCCKAAYGPIHPDIWRCQHLLADLYGFHMRDYAKAEALLQEVFRQKKKQLGALHQDTWGALGRLAELAEERGAWRKADALYTKTVNGLHKAVGERHAVTLEWQIHRATFCRDELRDFDQCRQILEQVLSVREADLGPLHPDTADVVWDLAELAAGSGRTTDAAKLYEVAINAYEVKYGPGHPRLLDFLIQFAGFCFRASGETERSNTILEGVWSICENAPWNVRSSNLEVVDALAEIAICVGDLRSAGEYYETAIARFASALSQTHRLVLQCRMRYAAFLNDELERPDDAKPILEELLAICERELGVADPVTLSVSKKLIRLALNADDIASADAQLVKTIATLGAIMGEDHALTDDWRLFFARVCGENPHRRDEARTMFLDSLAMREKAFGFAHPYTMAVVDDLARLAIEMNDYTEAEVVLSGALRRIAGPSAEVRDAELMMRELLANLYCEHLNAPQKALHEYHSILCKITNARGDHRASVLHVAREVAANLIAVGCASDVLALTQQFAVGSAAAECELVYCIGCCEGALGFREHALAHIAEALQGAPYLREAAAEEPSLEVLRDEIARL